MSPLDDVVTRRLVLRLMDDEAIALCLAGELTAAQSLVGAAIPAELLEKTTGLEFARARLAEDPDYQPWSIRAIIEPAGPSMVGHIRFHTTPDPEYLRAYARKAVEFGYHIFSPYRRRGFAAEAARAMMAWAEKYFGIDQFIVSVSPGNEPSLQLISRLGFVHVATWLDDIDGPEHVFLRSAVP
jgi:[ribosomal protein S5]-alanine N-acetyltransferase